MAETITMTMAQLRELLAAVGVPVSDDAAGAGAYSPGSPGFGDEGAAYGAAASKDRRIAARIDDVLYERARAASGIARDSDLVRAGLEALADPDEFGSWLAARRGSLPRDFTIDL
ncbi:MAG: hypothetical protein F4114_04635 [Rhodospirillaceae bacterium]|nr:hypothetical protein [Rhodospirillaceae bacterium]MYB14272.1 hypothetical protein [Rhodospirillaceae bacterium]MYI48360.1 hypothetical protein [Rhodospirillaceae bacterium]